MARVKRPATSVSKIEKSKTSSNESVVEAIIRRIKVNIRNGGYAPGQRLIEVDVQLMTGTSRGPVREAMRRLAAEGVLEILHQKGARVRKLTREDIEGLYDVREVIEGFAAGRAATQHKIPSFRQRLKDLDKEFVEKYDGSPQSWMDYNEHFHDFIVSQSSNIHLERALKNLQIPMVMLRLASFIDRDFVARAHSEHREITKHLLAGDSVKAERAMRKHVQLTKQTVLARAMLLADDK